MPKKSRDKGNRGQRAVAKLLSEWWGAKFASTPMSGGFATKRFRDDWNAAADVVTPDKTFPFSVEVKWQEKVVSLESLVQSDVGPLWTWWGQCVDEAPPGMIPLLVFKRNRAPWFYMMWTPDLATRYARYGTDRRLELRGPGWVWGAGSPTVTIGLFENLRKTEVDLWRNQRSLVSILKK